MSDDMAGAITLTMTDNISARFDIVGHNQAVQPTRPEKLVVHLGEVTILAATARQGHPDVSISTMMIIILDQYHLTEDVGRKYVHTKTREEGKHTPS